MERLVAAGSGASDAVGDEERRWEPARALVRLGEAAVGPVLRACEVASPGVMDALVAVLAGIGGPAVPSLIDALQAAAPRGREAAAEALGLIGDGAAVPALVEAVLTAAEPLRSAAAAALARIGESAVDPAMTALGTAAALLAVLHDPDAEVRALVAPTLGQLGAPVLPALVDAARAAEAHARWDVMHAISQVRDPAAARALVRLLRDPDWHLRSSAAMALGFMSGRSGVAALAPVLKDPEENVRLAAAAALGRIGGPRAAAALLRMRRDRSERVREAATAALAQITERATTTPVR